MTFKAESNKFIWINGEFVDSKDAKLHVLTHSLHYSGSVFEGEKAYNGKIFKLEEHVQRLMNSAKIMRLDVNYSFDEIMKAHNELLQKNNVTDSYIRPLIWRGSESMNITNKLLSVNLLIASVPSPTRTSPPFNIHVSQWRKPNPNAFPPQVKSSGHYAMIITAQDEAKSLGFDDALLLDHRDYVAECTTSNIFFVKGDTLITPIADSFLNGITRQTIIELARKLGIPTKEKHITLDKIDGYDECFTTGTAAEVKLIGSIYTDKNIIFEKNKVGSLLQKEYADLVRL